MHEVANTRVKSLVSKTEEFRIGIVVYKGPELSPYLFYLVIDKITKSIQGEVPWYR